MKGKIIMGKVNISDYQLSISSEIEKEEMELHLVNGARLRCIRGSEDKECILSVNDMSLVNYNGSQVIVEDCCKIENITDYKEGTDRKYFGKCSSNGKDCVKVIDLDQWINLSISENDAEKINGKEILTLNHILLCKQEGVIIPVTSGQDDSDAKLNALAALRERYYLRIARAVRRLSRGNGELLGHIIGGDPIDFNTGNFIFQKTDLQIWGQMPLFFEYTYQSLSSDAGVMGEGWTHNYEISLKLDKSKNEIELTLSDHHAIYKEISRNLYEPVWSDGSVINKWEKGFVYQKKNEKFYFDCNGILLKQEDNMGNNRIFEYDNALMLKKVLNNRKESLEYQYNAEGNLISVCDHTGREVSMIYQYGKLIRLITVTGTERQFEYNEDGKLNGIYNPQGIKTVVNEYDSIGRVVKQKAPNGGIWELMYDKRTNRSYLKKPDGNRIYYQNDEQNRTIGIIDSEGVTRIGYNAEGLRKSYEDKMNNLTQFDYTNGKITHICNALRQDIWITYDKSGNMHKLTLENGGTIETNFNYDGKLEKIINQFGDITSIQYDNHGRLKSIQFFDGNILTLAYHANGTIAEIRLPGENITKLEYDNLNRLIEKKDFYGNTTSYFYDAKNRVIQMIDPENNSREYQYDERDNITSIQDYDGYIVRFRYDTHNHVTCIVDKNGNETKRKYNLKELIEEEIYPNGAKERYEYDDFNRLTKKTNALSGETTYLYDKNGNCVNKNIAGCQYRYIYDSLNRMVSVIDADGAKSEYQYDESGMVSQIKDAMDNCLTIQHDLMGRITRWTYGNKIRTYKYNAVGQVTMMTDQFGRTVVYNYKNGLLYHIKYFNGDSKFYTYDSCYNIKSITNQRGMTVHYKYDNLNRLVSWDNNFGEKETYLYDQAGNILCKTDAQNNKKIFQYTPIGKVSYIQDMRKNEIQYEYDNMGNLSTIHKVVNGQEQTTKFIRNEIGKPIKIIDAMGLHETYEYNNVGSLVQKVDKEGNHTKYCYTKGGSVEKIDYQDGREVQYTYNSLKKLIEVKDWLGTTRIDRDHGRRIVAIHDHNNRTVAYEYNKLGLQSAIVYPNGRKVRYAYDDNARLLRAFTDECAVHYSYDKLGYLSKQSYSNGTEMYYEYDWKGRWKNFKVSFGNQVYEEYQYIYDSRGNRIQCSKYREGMPKESGTFQYVYDEMNQLIQIKKDGIRMKSYLYDEFGNRIYQFDQGKEIKYQYNSKNQLIVEEQDNCIQEYVYDKRGNLIKVYHNNQQMFQYQYNAINQLTNILFPHGEIIYEYNGLGNRIRKRIKKENDNQQNTLDYILDQKKQCFNLLQKIDEETIDFIWAGQIVSAAGKNGILYYHNNEKNSPVRISNHRGFTIQCYEYGEFGEDISKNQGQMQPIGYTGYLYEKESGNYITYSRGYMPDQGRFMSEDRYKGNLGNPISLNPYIYCYNQPDKYVDIDGNIPWTLYLILLGLGLLVGGCANQDEEGVDFSSLVPQPSEPDEPETAVNTPQTESPQIQPDVDINNNEGGYDLEEVKAVLKKLEDINYTERDHTIGVGHDTSKHGEDCKCKELISQDGTITKENIEILLEYDIKRLAPQNLDNLTANQMVAIISLSFNAGTVKSGDYIYDLLKENNFTSDEVMNGFLRYVRDRKIVSAGIIRRRIAEFLYFLTGDMHMDFEVDSCWPD